MSLFVIAALALAAFVFVEHRSTKPMINLAFFRRPTFTAGTICALAISFGMFGLSFFITLFFQNVQLYTPFQSGLRSLVCTMTFVFFTPLASKVAGRIGSRLLMSLGVAIFALRLFLFARVQIGTPYANIWPLLVILGFGMACVMAPMTVAVMRRSCGSWGNRLGYHQC